MSGVRVRRAGLVSYVVKVGSLLTGLVFVVIVTTHLTQQQFGLWSLVGKTLGYTLLPISILTFWTTRFRARGVPLGKTIVAGSAIFSAALSAIFLLISIPVAGTVSTVSPNTNLFYFILSSPQVALYTFASSFEALLWATSPEKNSVGFASFELAKVAIGFYTIDILRMSLTGAILTLVFAQAFQFVLTIFLVRGEFKDKLSLAMIGRMVKAGWLAILNNLHNLIRSFDFLIIAAFTGSLTLLALYGAAAIVSTAAGYSTFLSQGLYPNVLAGGDAKSSTKNVFELQLLFLCPMILGAIFLRRQLLHLLNPSYEVAAAILVVLAIGSGFDSLQSLFEYTISGSDLTDAVEKVDLGKYLGSKLFLVSKINVSLAGVYLAALIAIGVALGPGVLANPLSNNLILTVGIAWAVSNAGISLVALLLKVRYSQKIAPFVPDRGLLIALVAGSAVFGVLMYFIGIYYVPPRQSEIVQALNILGIGALGLAVYGAVVYALSGLARSLAKAIFQNLSTMFKK